MHLSNNLLFYVTSIAQLAAAQDGVFSVIGIDGSSAIEAHGSFAIDASFWDFTPSATTATNTETETLQVTSLMTSSLTTTISLPQVSSAPLPTPNSYSTSAFPTPTASASLNSTSFLVDVGAFVDSATNTTEFAFRPNNITAQEGDSVLFNMLGQSHSVTQSSFNNPCQSLGLFDTELQANPANLSDSTVKEFYVYTNEPLWFYCKQANHCQKGMVFAINPSFNTQMQSFINETEMSGPTDPPSTASMLPENSTTACGGFVTAAPSNTFQSVYMHPSSGFLPSSLNGTNSWLGWNASSSRSSNIPSPPPATAIPTSQNNNQSSTTVAVVVSTTGVSGTSRPLVSVTVVLTVIFLFVFGSL